MRLHLGRAEMEIEPLGEGDARQADGRAGRVLVIRLLQVGQVGADVPVRDHLGQRQHPEIAAGVIVVLVGIDDVAQRLARDGLDLRQDVGVIAMEHVVHEDDPFARHVERDVAALPRDHVQVAAHARRRQRTGWFANLGVTDPGAVRE